MAEYICTNCGYQGKKRSILPGSGTVELILWVVLLFPGPFYSLWRRVLGRKWGCPQCEKPETMFSVGSKVGKLKLEEVSGDISDDELSKIPKRWDKDIEEYNKKNGIVHQPKTIVKVESDKDEKW